MRLQLERVYGLLIHHASDLSGAQGASLLDALRDLQNKELVEKLGVSVYDARELDAVLEMFTLDIVQLPLNIFDQQLHRSDHLTELSKKILKFTLAQRRVAPSLELGAELAMTYPLQLPSTPGSTRR